MSRAFTLIVGLSAMLGVLLIGDACTAYLAAVSTGEVRP